MKEIVETLFDGGIDFSYKYLGIGIEFRTNFGLLEYEKFETNSYRGIRFFVHNIYLLIILYFISLPFESEK